MSDVLAHLDDALERVLRLREQLLRDPGAVDRARRLALVFAAEAHAWSQLFEIANQRVVWRAALMAEHVARRNATAWSLRAMADDPALGPLASGTGGSNAAPRSHMERGAGWAA